MALHELGRRMVVDTRGTEMKSFNARCVTVQNDNGVVMVGFADDEFETTEYLLFQRTLEPDAQDCELGQDKIHVQLDSPDQSGYGGVERIQLVGSTVTVDLNPAMSELLGTATIEVNLTEASVDYEVLKEHLSLVVGDEPILQVS